jgi:hypothetical protein
MMLPKVGVGGCTPMPMKPRTASKIIMRAMSSTAPKAMGGSTLGAIICKHDAQMGDAPRILAPRTYSR